MYPVVSTKWNDPHLTQHTNDSVFEVRSVDLQIGLSARNLGSQNLAECKTYLGNFYYQTASNILFLVYFYHASILLYVLVYIPLKYQGYAIIIVLSKSGYISCQVYLSCLFKGE